MCAQTMAPVKPDPPSTTIPYFRPTAVATAIIRVSFVLPEVNFDVTGWAELLVGLVLAEL